MPFAFPSESAFAFSGILRQNIRNRTVTPVILIFPYQTIRQQAMIDLAWMQKYIANLQAIERQHAEVIRAVIENRIETNAMELLLNHFM